MAFKMKGFPLIEGTSPAKKYVSDAQRKAVHASKAEKSAVKFNEGLRKASAEGKLDDNPKFKAAVDKSPTKLRKYGKRHDKLRAKGHQARAAADEAFDAGKKKKTDRLDRRADKKLGKARDIRVKQVSQTLSEKNPFKLKKDSPTKLSEKDKKKAMDNAMPEAKVRSRTYQDLQADKKAMKDSNKRLKEAKQRASIGGDPEKKAYDKAKARERKIQSKLNVSPLKVKKGDPASVTRRKNEGDAKGASLERRRGKAAAKGNTSKAKRLARKLRAHDATDNRGKQKARTTEVKKGGRIQF
jgi:hypothetical protein